MSRFLDRREPWLVEHMDRPDVDSAKLRNTFRQFDRVNRWISRWDAIYRTRIRPLLSPSRDQRLLDVGCGGGDMALRLRDLARSDGLRLEVVGLDPDPEALAVARARASDGVSFRLGYAGDLIREKQAFEFVISNHLLHHFADPDLTALLHDLEALATRRILCGDIERSRLGYALFSILTRPAFRNSYIREDGLTSIRKSFTRDELREVVPAGWTVERTSPFRLLAWCDVSAAGAVGRPGRGDATAGES